VTALLQCYRNHKEYYRRPDTAFTKWLPEMSATTLQLLAEAYIGTMGYTKGNVV
jgi:hypothetical protein